VPIQATTAYFYFFQIIYRANLAEQVFHWMLDILCRSWELVTEHLAQYADTTLASGILALVYSWGLYEENQFP
jgi:hypothetical protein